MDAAHKMADKEIEELTKRLEAEYKAAYRETRDKAKKHLKKFEKTRAEMAERLSKGEITQAKYNEWFEREIVLAKRYKALEKELCEDMHNANKRAAEIINESATVVYAENHNFGTFEIEAATGIDTSYALYSSDTVRQLMKGDKYLLPKRDPDWKKDYVWNTRKANAAVTQGILQGESMPKIAQRIARSLATSNMTSATLAARTMVTCAENKGRLDSYKRAEAMGIEMNKKWLSAHDSRTRDSHRIVDGESIPVDERFSVGDDELECPGDPDGSPAEVYNCRCTMIADLKDSPYKGIGIDYVDGITYEEWKAGKNGKR